MNDKPSLRQQMLARRLALPAVEAARLAQATLRHFNDHPILAESEDVAGYAAMRQEMDVLPILASLALLGRRTALPRVTGRNAPLTFHRWRAGEALVNHPLGMKEPAPDAPPLSPALVLVPLLGFDRSGHRLGYGGGYYDRTISALRLMPNPPLIIGVGYDFQEVAKLPAETHDVKLDGILTELGVSMFEKDEPSTVNRWR
jgi:5-formyltetrahydrofolate cyclo-ligase